MKILLLTLLILGCQTITLKHDPNLSSIESNYLTVETVCNDKIRVGNNGCFAKDGSMDSIGLKVRTIQSGLLTVFSQVCGINWTHAYFKSQYVDIPLKKIMTNKDEKSCLLGIVLNPNYKSASPVKVYGFQGEVLIRSVYNAIPATIFALADVYEGVVPIQTRKQPHERLEFHPGVAIDLSGSKLGFYRVEGCGLLDMGAYPKNDESTLFHDINLNETCNLVGAVIPIDSKKDMLFSIMVNVFDKDYNRLELPLMFNRKDDLVLDFEPEVIFVELGDKSYNDNELVIPNYNSEDKYVVRAYTVKGRYIMGIHEMGFWEWFN